MREVCPVIVSASRSTDIPAFYADWFFTRIEEGYSVWTNPFNRKAMRVSYKDTAFIVFWSKNPKPLLNHLDKLDRKNIGYYIQYTLNNYEKEKFEPNLPSYTERIETFCRLSEKIGKKGVIWRNDPLMLTSELGTDELLRRLERTGNALSGYTEKLVVSFVDINSYKNVKNKLKRKGIIYKDWTDDTMIKFAKELSILNKKWNYDISTCCEEIDLSEYGIQHNKCIDDHLIAKISYNDKKLMDYLGFKICTAREAPLLKDMTENADSVVISDDTYAIQVKKAKKDNGQRKNCGCIKSKDIGQYNTCKHFCVYCYANNSEREVLENYTLYCKNKSNERIAEKA
ncbi:MAG: DUF1848 domain-containing protein [Desulfovibrio sp.]|nr:DUF1848 domain-containing protein [Desulfovibrio sp.]